MNFLNGPRKLSGRLFLAGLCAVSISIARSSAFAKSAATVTVASDYNWRGISLTQYSGAAVQGDMQYQSDFGLTAGAWAGNIAFPGNYFGGYEFDPYLTYAHALGDFTPYVTFMWYTFVGGQGAASGANSIEGTVGLRWQNLNVSASYIPKYFGFDTSSTYLMASYTHNIDEKIAIVPTIGYVNVGKDLPDLWVSYMHYKLALQYHVDRFTTEFAYSKTDRRVISVTTNNKDLQHDDATLVSVTMAF